MKKEMKLVCISLALLFLLTLVTSVANAKTVGDYIKEGLTAITTGNNAEIASGIFVKILLMILVALLVYSVSDFLPFMGEKDSVKWLISIVVAVLSFLFVKEGSIQYIQGIYESLGIALTTFIPIVIIFVFTAKFREKHFEKSPVMVLIVNKGIGILFGLYMLVRWLTLTVNTDVETELLWVYPLTAALLIVWMVWLEDWVTFRIFKEKMKGEYEEADRLALANLNARLARNRDLIASGSGDKTLEELEKEQKSLMKKIDEFKYKVK